MMKRIVPEGQDATEQDRVHSCVRPVIVALHVAEPQRGGEAQREYDHARARAHGGDAGRILAQHIRTKCKGRREEQVKVLLDGERP